MKAMGLKKTKGLLFYTLLCLCLGVWGYVFYQVAHGFSQGDDPFPGLSLTPVPAYDSSAVPQRFTRATYDGAFRDPFALPEALFAARSSRSRPRAKPPPPEPPPLLLSGVVDNTALLHGDDGSVYVARSGEHIRGMKVVQVQRDRVVLHFQGRVHTLHLAQ